MALRKQFHYDMVTKFIKQSPLLMFTSWAQTLLSQIFRWVKNSR